MKKYIKNFLFLLVLFCQHLAFSQTNPFITSWSVTDGDEITIPVNTDFTYNFDYVWKDGSGGTLFSTAAATGDIVQSFTTTETVTLEITGDFPHFQGYPTDQLLDVTQWGDIVWGSMNSSFRDWPGDEFSATDSPELSQVTDMGRMFQAATAFIGDLSEWNVENVEDMSFMFAVANNFNGDIGEWTVDNVTNMNRMFNLATNFNADLSEWNVENVTDMERMFRQSAFDQDISGWDVGNVTTMSQMFSGSGLSTTNYDNLLVVWSAITDLRSNIIFDAGTSQACSAEAQLARLVLINDLGWNITDGGICNEDTDILAFELDIDQVDETVIDYENHTVTVTALATADITALIPDISILEEASISPASGIIQDFTGTVTYTVTAEDGITTQDWTVTVSNATVLQTETDILAFDLDSDEVTFSDLLIDSDNHEITFGAVISGDLQITPDITLSLGASISPADGIAIDLSDGTETYVVTAEDGNTQEWIITVTDLTPPSNDLCSNAITVNVDEVVTGNTTFATNDSNIASDCGSNIVSNDPDEDGVSVGVWYRFVGNGETITLNTCTGYKYDFDDTSMSVYTGSCSEGLTCLAGNEDANIEDECGEDGYQARLSFNSQTGVDYFILVDGYSDSKGEFDLAITGEPTLPPPVNDNCEEAEALTVFGEGAGTPTAGTNANATTFTRVVECDFYGTINDVWYTFNSGANTEIVVDIALTDTDDDGELIAAQFISYELYDDCDGEGLDVCGGDGTNTVEVAPNTDYWLQLWNTPQDEGTFTIQINDGPNTAAELSFENAVADAIDISRFTETGIQIDSVIADDDEEHAQLFSITAGNEEGIFAIDAEIGAITIVDEALLNGSATTSFALTIQSADQGPGDISSEVTLTINVIDNAPPVVEDLNIAIDENFPQETVFATLAFSDPDGDGVSFEIIENSSGVEFLVVANSGELGHDILDSRVVDFETFPVTELTVVATDNGPLQLTDTATVIITLNDINEAPVLEAAAFDISQFSENGFSVGTIPFTDQDAGQTHTYAILDDGDNDGAIFSIDAATGALTVLDQTLLSANGETTYTFDVEVTDDGAAPLSATAAVTVNTFGNNAPVITSETYTVDENTSNGSVVGTLEATDADEDGVTFSLEDEPGVFAVGTNGEITVADNGTLDFETNPSFEILVGATDDGTGALKTTKTITITLTDVNEAPEIASATFDISSLSADGSIVGQIEAADQDGDVLSYAITSGNEDGIFAIDPTGILSIVDASLLDPITTPELELTVTVSDGELTESAEITINVFLNSPPVLNTLAFSIDENSGSGAILGTLEATDNDGIDSYEITLGNEAELFEINETTGELSVANDVIFDFEETQSYPLGITVTDNGLGNVSITETITISINDVNEFDPEITNVAVNTLDEQSAVGTQAAQITATDDDIFQTLSYAITAGNTGDAFTINNNGSITVNDTRAVDFETTPVFTLTVAVSDNLAPVRTVEETVVITLQDVEESTETDMLTFSLEAQTADAVIDTDDHTVAIEVAFGTDVTTLAPSLTLSAGATSDPASGATVDFTNVVTYTVTAQDVTITQDWTVTVTVAPLTGTDILTFVLAEQTGDATINTTNHTVAIEVTSDTDVTALIPTFTLSEGATSDPASGFAADFTGAVTYTITAEDETTMQNWTVTVTIDDDEEVLETKDDLEWVVYPNPSSDFVYIDAPETVTVSLLDINGRSMMSGIEGKNLQLDISSFDHGMYFLIIQQGNRITKRKIVKIQ